MICSKLIQIIHFKCKVLKKSGHLSVTLYIVASNQNTVILHQEHPGKYIFFKYTSAL